MEKNNLNLQRILNQNKKFYEKLYKEWQIKYKRLDKSPSLQEIMIMLWKSERYKEYNIIYGDIVKCGYETILTDEKITII